MVQKTIKKNMVNEDYDPSDRQERLLAVFKDGREEGRPWGYATVKRLSEESDTRKQYVSRDLEGLLGAGWVEKPYRGLYRYVRDPRERDDE